MAHWRMFFAAAALLQCGGCVLNDAYELRDAKIRPDQNRATIIFGAFDDRFPDTVDRTSIQLDHYSLEKQGITGNCSRYTRLDIERSTVPGVMEYFIFSAPPGHYVLSPFLNRPVEGSARYAFLAPAGQVTYLGEFSETGGEAPFWAGPISRSESLAAASAFAASRGLPEPRIAVTTPVEDFGPIFVCMP